MKISDNDRTIIRDLAALLAEIAALPIQGERTRLWKKFNALRPERPMVLTFPEGGWVDLVDESKLLCENDTLRHWEHSFRQKIYQFEEIPDDQPVTDMFKVSWAIRGNQHSLRQDIIPAEGRGAFGWDPPIKSYDDLKKLTVSPAEVDREETARNLEFANDMLGDILNVQLRGGPWCACGQTMQVCFLRGTQNVMTDMYDNPKFLHELFTLLRDHELRNIEYFEREGLFTLNNGADDYCGSGGLGGTDELPAADFDGHVRRKDLWGLIEIQAFAGVGPDLFWEFALQYQLPMLEPLGLSCYGCCEPLHDKLHLLIKHVPNLRRVSISPWSDREISAQKLTDKYIYSWKPNPAFISSPSVDYDECEQHIRETMEIAQGCCLEIVMKDTHTFQADPDRPKRWTEIASRIAQE